MTSTSNDGSYICSARNAEVSRPGIADLAARRAIRPSRPMRAASRDEDRAVPVAHARAVRQQRVPIRPVRVGVERHGASLRTCPRTPPGSASRCRPAPDRPRCPSTCTAPLARPKNMNASSESGLWATVIFIGSSLAEVMRRQSSPRPVDVVYSRRSSRQPREEPAHRRAARRGASRSSACAAASPTPMTTSSSAERGERVLVGAVVAEIDDRRPARRRAARRARGSTRTARPLCQSTAGSSSSGLGAGEQLEHARFELRLGERLELLERAVGELRRRQPDVTGERVRLVLEQHARDTTAARARRRARAVAIDRRDASRARSDGTRTSGPMISRPCRPATNSAAGPTRSATSSSRRPLTTPTVTSSNSASASSSSRTASDERRFGRRRREVGERAVVVGEQQQMPAGEALVRRRRRRRPTRRRGRRGSRRVYPARNPCPFRRSSRSRMSDAQARTSRPATRRRSACMRRRRSQAGMSMRARDRRGEAALVVRIDDQRLGQLLRGAGQLAQNQHAVEVVARGDELLGDEVHPVVQRRDDAEVARAGRAPRAPAAGTPASGSGSDRRRRRRRSVALIRATCSSISAEISA